MRGWPARHQVSRGEARGVMKQPTIATGVRGGAEGAGNGSPRNETLNAINGGRWGAGKEGKKKRACKREYIRGRPAAAYTPGFS